VEIFRHDPSDQFLHQRQDLFRARLVFHRHTHRGRSDIRRRDSGANSVGSAIEIELIASENIVSRAVLEAQGSVLTNKYARVIRQSLLRRCEWPCGGDAGDRSRQETVRRETLPNVQPNSGSQMNQAVFLALLQPGDSFMGLDLAAGGHLTHGSPVNMSANGSRLRIIPVRREDQLIDMDAVAKQAEQVKRN